VTIICENILFDRFAETSDVTATDGVNVVASDVTATDGVNVGASDVTASDGVNVGATEDSISANDDDVKTSVVSETLTVSDIEVYDCEAKGGQTETEVTIAPASDDSIHLSFTNEISGGEVVSVSADNNGIL
jgi:hypothetical protein